MPRQAQGSYDELQAEVAELIEKNELLERELTRVWRDALRLAGTNLRLFNENQDLINRYRSQDRDCDMIAA